MGAINVAYSIAFTKLALAWLGQILSGGSSRIV